MQNIVSKQTAIALREAGFPQPELEFGQIFFSAYYAGPIVYMRKGCGGTLVLRSPRGFNIWENPESPDLLFAPSATEILPHFSVPHLLWYDDEKQWCCTHLYYSVTEMDEVFAHKNPAEAVAAAWLAYNRSK